MTVVVLGVVCFILGSPQQTSAIAGINQQLNYQARLLTSAGAVVPDGTYNVEFKIYQDGDGCMGGGSSPCSGTLKWTETRTNTNRITVKNGYFSTQLGAVTPFGANVDWNQDTLWLSINIGGTAITPSWDGEMTPFRRLSASPYALNAGKLGGLEADRFLQIAPSAVQVDSGTLDSIALNKTGTTGNILRLQKNGSDIFMIDNSGKVAVGGIVPTQKFEVQDGDAAFYNSGNNARLIIGDSGVSGQYGYLQWDSTNDYFRIEKNGSNGLKINDNFVSIGNIFPDSPLKVGNGSTLLMSVSTTGAFTAQNSADSTNAFRVLNAGGTTVLNVDTTNGRVGIGGNFTPDQALDVVGNFQVGDSATPTKSYRVRTGGGALDMEASGADLYLSTWSGADFSGTQYNQITFKADGGSMDFGRGFNVAAGSKVGIGTNDPNETLEVNGIIQQNGRITSNTGAADANKWTKLATCTMDAQYEGCIATLNILGGLDGSSADNTQAGVSIRTRQQDPLASPPIVNVQLNGVSQVIDNSDIVAVTTQNDGTATVVQVWGRITNAFEAWRFTPTLNIENEWAWHSTDGFSAALPAGTQTVASYGDIYADALQVTGGMQILNAASTVVYNADTVANTFTFGDAAAGQAILDVDGGNGVLTLKATDGSAIYLGQYNGGAAELATDADLHIIRNTDSASAFELLDSSNNALLTMDTVNKRFRIQGAGTNGSGSRLHFGDYDNIYIGENGTTDTDRMLLYGGEGFTLSSHYGTPMTISGQGVTVHKTSTDSATAFQIQNAASTSIFTVNTSAGNVTINASSAAYTQRLCHNQANGATANLTLGDCAATGQADLAEFYAVDGDAEPGDIVTPGGGYAVKRSTTSAQANVIGIVSTNPVADGILGHNVKDASRQPIALAGRIPLKVSLENGEIKSGDLLTAGSTPGTAARATGTEPIVGIALEPYGADSPRVSSLVSIEESARLTAHPDLPPYTSDPSKWPTSTGKIMAFLRLSGGSTPLDQTAIQQAVFDGGLIAGDTTFGGLVAFNKNVTFHGDVVFDDTITLGEDSAGTATLPTGQTAVNVTFTKAYSGEPIVNTTPTQFISGSYRVTNVTEGGFTIELSLPQTTPTKFNWTAFSKKTAP
ncbi:hypothetical protein PV379_03750 [Streptomyces caniscabiei]|uniref:hypothetical protein n=1 Tax=Streptomyces caniscabiei TaxID=2746961 RepID=UPI0029BBCB10|nr:hypothetical protein [Streptomyces caniscabiei]MDX2776454.1 hypothetical protein [Streptomyces caniscabiei]